MNWIKKIFRGESKESLMDSFVQIYNDLKSKNPDKDEHWLLAHTWLTRYGDWEASKQKGPRLTRFIAYKETFQYSLLDSPKSINGLVLYLVYKELGEKEAESRAEEFGLLVNEIEDVLANGNLLDIYKVKNPFTWKEAEQEGDESMHGLLGFLKAADHLNKNPDEQERAVKELERLDRGEKSEGSINDVKFSESQIAEIKQAIEKDK